MSDQDKNQERPLFEGIDEFERTYAPEELPRDDPEQKRARLEQSTSQGGTTDLEPPPAAPVGTIGTSPSGGMAPVNLPLTNRDIASSDSPANDTEADDDEV